MNDIWTIQAALDWTVGYLERKGDENPRLSAQWLLSEATGLSRIELYANFEQPLSMEERDVLRAYVTRRGKGEPLQYITGEVGFRHITVKVRPGVLIPRPETEVLVSEALALLPAAPKRVAQHAWPEDDLPPVPWPEGEAGEQRPERTADQGVAEDESTPAVASGEPAPEPPELLVADLCTGSGCIACSVAYEHPLARVVATDIVPEAVALARDNVAALELGDRVEVLSCDLGEGVDPTLMGAFDLVVSNPPYVPTAVMDDIPREVAEFEPALALDGGADGLDVLRRLLPWCRRALKEGGGFAFELHETCRSRRLMPFATSRALRRGAADSCRRGRLLRCSRHGRSRRAPPCSHRPKARRVGRIFGAARFPCEPRRFRQDAASRAGGTGLCAAGCTVSLSDVRQKRGFGSHRPVPSSFFEGCRSETPGRGSRSLQNAVPERVVGAKTSILPHVTPAKRCARPVSAASAQDRRSWNPPSLPNPRRTRRDRCCERPSVPDARAWTAIIGRNLRTEGFHA